MNVSGETVPGESELRNQLIHDLRELFVKEYPNSTEEEFWDYLEGEWQIFRPE